MIEDKGTHIQTERNSDILKVILFFIFIRFLLKERQIDLFFSTHSVVLHINNALLAQNQTMQNVNAKLYKNYNINL